MESPRDQPKKDVLNFMIRIQQTTLPDGTPNLDFAVVNEGIPASDILLLLETWLEGYKEAMKKKVRDAGGSAFRP